MKKFGIAIIVALLVVLAAWGYMRVTCSILYARDFEVQPFELQPATSSRTLKSDEEAQCKFADLLVTMFFRKYFAW